MFFIISMLGSGKAAENYTWMGHICVSCGYPAVWHG